MAIEKCLVEAAEQGGEAFAAELLGLGDRQQLDEETGQLDEVIVRAPGMAVARPDGETEGTVERCRRIEVAHRMNDMIKTARHGKLSLVPNSSRDPREL